MVAVSRGKVALIKKELIRRLRTGEPMSVRAIREAVGGSPRTILKVRAAVIAEESLAWQPEPSQLPVGKTDPNQYHLALVRRNAELAMQVRAHEETIAVLRAIIADREAVIEAVQRGFANVEDSMRRPLTMAVEASRQMKVQAERLASIPRAKEVQATAPNPSANAAESERRSLMKLLERHERLRSLYHERTGELPPDD